MRRREVRPDPCTSNSDGESGWCVQHVGDRVCANPCVEECPAGFECKPIAASGQDVQFVCLSNFTNLCRPCVTGDDCKSPSGVEDAGARAGAGQVVVTWIGAPTCSVPTLLNAGHGTNNG